MSKIKLSRQFATRPSLAFAFYMSQLRKTHNPVVTWSARAQRSRSESTSRTLSQIQPCLSLHTPDNRRTELPLRRLRRPMNSRGARSSRKWRGETRRGEPCRNTDYGSDSLSVMPEVAMEVLMNNNDPRGARALQAISVNHDDYHQSNYRCARGRFASFDTLARVRICTSVYNT